MAFLSPSPALGAWRIRFCPRSHCSALTETAPGTSRKVRLRATVKCLADSAVTKGMIAGLSTVPETPNSVQLDVHGEIPPWLAGTLDRVGPGTFEATAGDGSVLRMQHWFDGLSHVHRFEIGANGEVSYRSKHVAKHVERAIQQEKTTSDVKTVMIGTVPNPKRRLFGKLASALQSMSTDSTTPNAPAFPIGVTVEHGRIPGQGMALTTDAPVLLKLNSGTLEPESFVSYEDLGVRGGEMLTAHGVFDSNDGAYYTLLSQLVLPKGPCKVVRVDPENGKASVFATISKVPATYMHSFAMTEKYFVVIANSSRVGGLRVLTEGSFLGGLSFDQNEATQLYVLDRSTGEHVATYEGEPSFNFHIANAFDVEEDDGDASVCVDICRYQDMEVFGAMTIDNMISSTNGGDFPETRLTRYTLSKIKSVAESAARRSAATEEVLCEGVTVDLPYINGDFQGRSDYRYVYGVSQNKPGGLFSSVTKLDVHAGTADQYAPLGCHLSEPVFVHDPTADPEDEDAGVVLVIENSFQESLQSSLVVLDAKSMKMVARCESSLVVPFSFHGSFVTETDL